METNRERRRRKLLELIDAEGGLEPGGKVTPGHYIIARRVVDYEDQGADHKQMAQSLAQAAKGFRDKSLGDGNARRIEAAYQADQCRFGIKEGWFDNTDPLEPDESDVTEVTVHTSDNPVRPFIQGGNIDTNAPLAEITWEQVMHSFGQLPDVFSLRVTEPVLAPLVSVGDVVVFKKTGDAHAGDFVVIRSRRSGAYMLRQVRELEPGVFRAVGGPDSNIEPLTTPDFDIVAVHTAVTKHNRRMVR